MSSIRVSLASAISNFHTISDWVRFSLSENQDKGVFYGHGTDNAFDDAKYLILGVLNIPWSLYDIVSDNRLAEEEKHRLYKAIEQRCLLRLPVPYITGTALYSQLEFFVDQTTLIPRSPIRELIEEGFQPWLPASPNHILDLCCGSGCIGILSALQFDEAKVDLSDLSAQALLVAKKNVIKYDLQRRVSIFEGDLFAPLNNKRYDLIISNPPYVDAEDLSDMPAEFLAEPKLALASGEDGLAHVKGILSQASDYLTDDGVLICEVGNSAAALNLAYPQVPFTWLEFETGGFGVFVLTKEQLQMATF